MWSEEGGLAPRETCTVPVGEKSSLAHTALVKRTRKGSFVCVVLYSLSLYYPKMIKRIKELSQYQRIQNWYKKYERLLLPGVLVFGFVGDAIAVRAIDLDVIRYILLVHLVNLGLGIVIRSLPKEKVQGRVMRYIRLFAPLAMLYSFGALFSIFIVIYSFNGSIIASWPFLLPLLILFLGTELFKKQYEQILVQTGAFFFALMSYFILFVPYLLREISTKVFVLSSSIGLAIMLIYILATSSFVPNIKEKKDSLLKIVIGIFVLINTLYFINAIPPFPLSLREIGVFHNVERSSQGEYLVLAENKPWYSFLLPFDTVHTRGEQGVLYVYSSIFAPTRLSTDVVHNWKKLQGNKWVSMNKVSYQLVGGREGGYRGYSYKTNVSPGWWRVVVETRTGKIIGALTFRVVYSDGSPELHIKEY